MDFLIRRPAAVFPPGRGGRRCGEPTGGKEPQESRSVCTYMCVHVWKHYHSLHICVDLVVSEIEQKHRSKNHCGGAHVRTRGLQVQ